MKIKFLIVSFTIINSVCFCQKFTDIYHDYIPSKLQNDSYMRDIIENTLEASSKINPELIFYQLLRFNNAENSNFDSKSSLLLVNQIQDNYLLKRQEWAQKIIEKIKDTRSNENYYNEAKELLNEYLEYSPIKSQKVSSNLHIDTTAIDEIVVLYYSKFHAISSDSLKGFIEQRKTLEEKRRNKLLSFNRELNFVNRNKYLKELINNWYLFPVSNSFRINDSTSLTFDQIFIKAIDNNYKMKNLKELSFEGGITGFFNRQPWNILLPDYSLDTGIPIPHKSFSASIACSFKYFLRDVPGIFSFIKLRVSYSYMRENASIYNNGYVFNATPYVSYSILASKNPTISTLNTFSVQLGTPVFCYYSSLSIEPLICIGKSRFSYDLKYIYVKNDYLNHLTEGRPIEIKGSQVENILGVGVEMFIRLSNKISLDMAVIPKRYQLLLSYGISI